MVAEINIFTVSAIKKSRNKKLQNVKEILASLQKEIIKIKTPYFFPGLVTATHAKILKISFWRIS